MSRVVVFERDDGWAVAVNGVLADVKESVAAADELARDLAEQHGLPLGFGDDVEPTRWRDYRTVASGKEVA